MMAKTICTPLRLVFLLLLGGTVHAASLDHYTHHAEIKTEGAGPFFHLALSMAVYRKSLSPGLQDLGVFNAAGEIVPHALTLKTDLPQPQVAQVELRGFPLYSDAQSENQGIQIRREENGTLVSIAPTKPTVTHKLSGVILDASLIESPLVALDISLIEYRQPFQRFSIEASDDLKNWHVVQNSATIAVLQQDSARIEQRRVEFPPIRAKYLRLNWLDPQDIPSLPKIIASTSTTPEQSQPELLWSEPLAPWRGKNGELIYRLNGSLPVERIRFLLPQLNTLTPAQLLVRGIDKQPWRRLSDTVLYRLASKGKEYISPDIDLDGEPIGELQIQLDARAGGVGDTPPQIKIALRPQQLVFLARGPGPFTLAWGMPGATASALPLTTIVPAYRYQDGLPGNLASIGIETGNTGNIRTDHATANTHMDSTVMRKWLLWAVLVLGAAVLLLMAWKLIRSSEHAAK
jgi:hypothetical protein